ncbi:MAG: DeoR/GlpR transcriptional regulator [Tissierellia bacterium]|nr:DeoR/GlpR transcriptional regulator [Tissierellia bacterium]
MILAKLEEHGLTKVQELAKEFDVSIETIRRDLEFLEKQSKLKRVHGGAIQAAPVMDIADFQIRKDEYLAEKKEVSSFAYHHLPNNSMIFMDSSTTNLEISKLYKNGSKKATIVTNSILIALELSESTNIELILLGGKVDSKEKSTYGTNVLMALNSFHADYALISTSGISEDFGITDYNPDLGEIQKLMLKNSVNKIIIADSSKFNQVSNYKIASFDEISTIITDSKIKDETFKKYSSLVEILF